MLQHRNKRPKSIKAGKNLLPVDVPSLAKGEGHLAFIPDLLQKGKWPDGLLPSGPTAELAAVALRKCFFSDDGSDVEHNVSQNPTRLEAQLPFGRLITDVAVNVFPYVSRSRPTLLKFTAIRNAVLHHFEATEEAGDSTVRLEENRYRLYEMLSQTQLELMWLLPTVSPATMQSATPADFWRAVSGLYDRLINVAVQAHAWHWLNAYAPEQMCSRALDFVCGRTGKCDWWLGSAMRLATKLGNDEDLMECLTTSPWGGLPSTDPDKPHFKNENPADQRMRYLFGLASLKSGWEQHPNPAAWMRKVAWNLRRRRKNEDEGEYISAKKNGVELVPDETSNGRAAKVVARDAAVRLAPPVKDPFAAILPVSEISVDGLHLAVDVIAACRNLGLSEDATKLLRGKAASANHKCLAEHLGFSPKYLKAKEQELRRALPALRETLAPYKP